MIKNLFTFNFSYPMSMNTFSRVFISLVIIFTCLEMAGRIFFADAVEGRFEYGYAENAGFKDRHDGVDLIRAGGRRFFPQSMAMPKPDNVFRVFVVGDSVPRGKSGGNSYGEYLPQYFSIPNKKIEVMNMGVPGFGARRINIMVKRALKYQPDLIVLHLNNSNEFEDEREWRRAQDFKGWHPRNWLMKSVLLRRLFEFKTEKMLWRWLPTEIRQLGAINDVNAELEVSMNAQRVKQRWNPRIRKVTNDTVSSIQQSGAELLVVIQANYFSNKDSVSTSPILASMAKDLSHQSIAVLNMQSALSNEKASVIFADGSHLHMSGHHALAKALAAKLMKENIGQ